MKNKQYCWYTLEQLMMIRERKPLTFFEKVESLFPDCDVFEAFTSRMIIKRLKARGIARKIL